jgi:hypothetical protein
MHRVAEAPVLRRGAVSFPLELKRPGPTMVAMVLAGGAAVGAGIAIRPLMGALVVVAVAAALSLSQRPALSVYLMVMFAPTCAGLNRGLLIPGLRVSEAAIAGCGLLVLVFASRVERPKWTTVETLLLLYALTTVVLGGYDLISRHAPLTTEELGTMLGPLQFVIMVRAIIVAMTNERRVYRAAVLMLAAVSITGPIALAQYASLGPTRSIIESVSGGTGALYEKSLQEGIGRVTGPFAIWHELAGLLMPCVLLSLAMMLSTDSVKRRIGFAVMLTVTFGALVSTATVGVPLLTILGGLYITWKRGVLHIAATLAVPVVLVVLVIFGSSINGRAEQQYGQSSASYSMPLVPQSIAYRYMLFKDQNAPAIAGRWATGFGPDLPPQLALGNFPFAQTTYILLLMRGGVPLLAMFLLLSLAVVQAARAAQMKARTDLQWSLSTVVLLTSIAYLFLQLIEAYLVDSGPPQAYWAVVALMIAASRHQPDQRPGHDRKSVYLPIQSAASER